jgi:hypothetical protein
MDLFEYKGKFDHQFWLAYMFCCGVGVHKPQDQGKPLIVAKQKFLCIEEALKCTPNPAEEGVFCAGVGTFLCCWEQCQLPPAENNPGFACANKVSKKVSSSASPMSYGKGGAQMEMS